MPASSSSPDTDLPAVAADIIESAIVGRRSVRDFSSQPVPIELVERILLAARRAPSSTNMQPWKVDVVTEAARTRLVAAILDTENREPGVAKAEFIYYPQQWRSPYAERRRQVGLELYRRLGIKKEDQAGARQQLLRNYDFFGAPVGLILSIDRDLEAASWLDIGMFMQNIMIMATGCGLASCPQLAFAKHHAVIRHVLGIPADRMILCGIALGYEQIDSPLHTMTTERADLDVFVRFHHQ